jgi:phosphate transport system substrate-binding protein
MAVFRNVIMSRFALLWMLAAFVLGSAASLANAQEIRGSGSTFAYPVVTKWAEAYRGLANVHVDYHPIGSSAGIAEIRSGEVDFGLTDAPLADAQLLRDGLAQFPILIGAIVPIVNLPGLSTGQLRFTGRILADIYLGKIKDWNDPAIALLNPGISLPHRPILVMYRSDGSGTTYNWTDFLSKQSAEWQARVGVNTTVAWPVGTGAKGNGGLARAVAQVKGAIGFVEYSYALRANLVYGLVQNRAGHFVRPDAPGLLAAAGRADWKKELDFYVLLSDSDAAEAYPIVGTTFALTRRYPKDAPTRRATIGFFRWALEKGQDLASSQNYLPVPESVVARIEGYWEE